ncbi:MAG TPA: dihydrofolate reductase family protein [Solirubrobacteraceae bacterium]|nr:dihydrofolate reductase family protein [Solirubrobacteraceae bacterium]
MSKLVNDVSISLDGYSTGLNQSLENPFGEGVGERLHEWYTQEAEANAKVIERMIDAGAFIMGRNMFSPGRGAWDLDWKGWWGDNPPYHGPVFILTHHEREPVEMEGGTTYHFVTDGIEAALGRAREAAGDRNISIAGGAQTVRQYLAAGLLDELRIHIVPVILGAGERLLDDVGDVKLEQVESSATNLVTHITYKVVK